MTHQTLEFLLRHGLWILFTWVLAEQLGAPLPSFPVLLATGALIGLERVSFPRAMLIVLAACLSADVLWYSLGRRRGRSVLRLLCRISLEPDSCVSSTEGWFRRMGLWSLVIAKFIPGLGGLAAPMAGLSGLRVLPFLAVDTLGVVAWSGIYLGAGYLFRAGLEDAGEFVARLGGSLLGFVVGIATLWIGFKFWKRTRFLRRLRMARIGPQEVFERLSDFLIVDLRSGMERERDGMQLPGALWFDRRSLELHREEIPRDRDIVLYCT